MGKIELIKRPFSFFIFCFFLECCDNTANGSLRQNLHYVFSFILWRPNNISTCQERLPGSEGLLAVGVVVVFFLFPYIKHSFPKKKISLIDCWIPENDCMFITKIELFYDL